MDSQSDRSEQVVEAYKRHKLASSVLKRIHQIIEGFEQDRRLDTHVARIGLVVSILLIAALSFYFFGRAEVVISQ